jgi:MFS transporter, DHA3 family, macrolide efflux protein
LSQSAIDKDIEAVAPEESGGLGRQFHTVQIAALLNGLGTRCGQLAVAWWALAETGSATAFAAFVAIGVAAEVAARGLFGWFGDQYRPHRIIAGCYLISASTMLVLALLYAADAYHSYALAAGLALIGVCSGVGDPLQTTVIRTLVPVRRVELAVRRRSVMTSTASLLGPVVAGVSLSLVQAGGTLVIDTAAVCLSSVLVLTVSTPRPDVGQPREGSHLNAWYQGTCEGFRYLYAIKSEYHLALLALVVNLALYPLFGILIPALVHRSFPGSAWAVGVVEGGFAVGLVLGGLGVVNRVSKAVGRAGAIFSGFGLLGLGMVVSGAAVYFVPGNLVLFVVVATISLTFAGVGLVLVNINASTVRALASPHGMRNRMMASAGFASGLASPVGSLFSGVFSDTWSEEVTMLGLGVLILVAVAVASRSSHISRVMSLSDTDVVDAYQRLYPAALSKPGPMDTAAQT